MPSALNGRVEKTAGDWVKARSVHCLGEVISTNFIDQLISSADNFNSRCRNTNFCLFVKWHEVTAFKIVPVEKTLKFG